MRSLILVAGTALALAACRNSDQVQNTGVVDQNLSADNVVTNDVTAIDAVTGADANMAADVDYLDNGLNDDMADLNGAEPSTNKTTASPKPTKQAPKTPTKPDTDSTGNNSI